MKVSTLIRSLQRMRDSRGGADMEVLLGDLDGELRHGYGVEVARLGDGSAAIVLQTYPIKVRHRRWTDEELV